VGIEMAGTDFCISTILDSGGLKTQKPVLSSFRNDGAPQGIDGLLVGQGLALKINLN